MELRSRILYNPSIKRSMVSVVTISAIVVSLLTAVICKSTVVTNYFCIPLLAVSSLAYILEAVDGRFMTHMRVTNLHVDILDKENKAFKLIYEPTTLTEGFEKTVTDAKDIGLILDELKIRITDNNGDKLVDIILDNDKEFIKAIKFFYEELGLRLASCN